MNVGILVIGSLCWDNNDRKAWRTVHLNMSEKIPVKVPIKYGRKSRTWGNTYTMVLSNSVKMGKAVVIPCINPIENVKDLILEASALWRAERSKAKEGEVGVSWGCVGMLFRIPQKSADIVEMWERYFQNHSEVPITPVNSRGILDISWTTKLDDSPVTEVDIILSAVTKAEEPLPTVDKIAEKWINQDNGYESYFFKNVENDIRTAEDIDIWKIIEKHSPGWLSKTEYAEAISILRKESQSSS